MKIWKVWAVESYPTVVALKGRKYWTNITKSQSYLWTLSCTPTANPARTPKAPPLFDCVHITLSYAVQLIFFFQSTLPVSAEQSASSALQFGSAVNPGLHEATNLVAMIPLIIISRHSLRKLQIQQSGQKTEFPLGCPQALRSRLGKRSARGKLGRAIKERGEGASLPRDPPPTSLLIHSNSPRALLSLQAESLWAG